MRHGVFPPNGIGCRHRFHPQARRRRHPAETGSEKHRLAVGAHVDSKTESGVSGLSTRRACAPGRRSPDGSVAKPRDLRTCYAK
ncbi:protein of unknown function [Burkholderia multivorans]